MSNEEIERYVAEQLAWLDRTERIMRPLGLLLIALSSVIILCALAFTVMLIVS
jgi:hypothetical protein